MIMDTQVTLAGVALLGTLAALASPILMSMLTNRNARALKMQDWARQDEVAAKAESAAARNASLIAELNQATTEATRVTVGKLDVIHTLVNSTLTAAMQVALDGVKRELVLLEHDSNPDPALVAATTKKIAELESIVEERNRQTALADLQEQIVSAAKAGQAVGVLSAVRVPISAPLGDVTGRVLRGEAAPVVGSNHGLLTETQKTAQIDAAIATVDAAGTTVAAASKTVEAMKKK